MSLALTLRPVEGARCFGHGFAPDAPKAVRAVLFGSQYVPVCQGCLDKYRALDLDDPEVNVTEKRETDLTPFMCAACMTETADSTCPVGNDGQHEPVWPL